MRGTDSEFEREDALACADVLGGFGVTSDDVRDRVDGDAADLESAIRRALAEPEYPTAFLARTIAGSPRGVDAPARFWTTAPATQLGDAFAAIDWTFDVRGANGRSLSVEDAQPYRFRVEDARGRTRSTTFSFPDTALGDDNYPALVHAVNEELLYGLSARFVQLSDGTDRWRFALVDAEELDRLRDRFGERIAPFDRPLLAADGPAAYVPDADAGSDDASGGGDGGVPVPSWAREAGERSWRGRRLTADAFDADAVGGLDHLDDDSGSAGDGLGNADDESVVVDATEPESAADAIEFVGGEPASATSSEPADAAATGTELGTPGSADTSACDDGGSTVVRDAETDEAVASAATSTGEDAKSTDDDLDGWSIGGSVDATTRSADDGGSTVDGQNDDSAPDASTGGALSASGFDWGEDATEPEEEAVDGGGDDAGDGFFAADAAASFDAGAETSRVDGDSFGVDAGEATEDDEFVAVGAALAAPAGISVSGLLDDDGFLPELPRAKPERTRIEFDAEFDPAAAPSADEREAADGFVWVNEGADDGRRSAFD